MRSPATDLGVLCGDVWCPCARGGECAIRRAIGRDMYYACEIRSVAFMFPEKYPGNVGCPRYELIVIDWVRDRRFDIGFTIDPSTSFLFRGGHRAYLSAMHDGCEARLWRGIKRESPGTFLEARALGWVPECLTRDDLPR